LADFVPFISYSTKIVQFIVKGRNSPLAFCSPHFSLNGSNHTLFILKIDFSGYFRTAFLRAVAKKHFAAI
jgi:hypothetical protein